MENEISPELSSRIEREVAREFAKSVGSKLVHNAIRKINKHRFKKFSQISEDLEAIAKTGKRSDVIAWQMWEEFRNRVRMEMDRPSPS